MTLSNDNPLPEGVFCIAGLGADALDAKVQHWLAHPTGRGRASCPCGHVTSNAKIREHRVQCPMWSHYVQMQRRLRNA